VIELCEVVLARIKGRHAAEPGASVVTAASAFCIDSTALLQQRHARSLLPASRLALSSASARRLRGAAPRRGQWPATGGRWSDGDAGPWRAMTRALAASPLDLSNPREAAIGGASARSVAVRPLPAPFLLRPGRLEQGRAGQRAREEREASEKRPVLAVVAPCPQHPLRHPDPAAGLVPAR